MKRVFIVILISVVFFAVSANGSIIEFTDNTIYMPTWESSDRYDNQRDSIEHPEITDGRLTIEGNTLKSVSFDYEKKSCGMGDLFIDSDNNGYFDYVLNMEKQKIYDFADGILSSEKGQNDNLYLTSDDMYRQGRFDANTYRNDHFVAINTDSVQELVDHGSVSILDSFNGYDDQDWFFNIYQTGGVYGFDEFSLEMDYEFSLFFAPLCANDVIAHTVPIPASFILFGSSVFGLIGIRRKCVRN